MTPDDYISSCTFFLHDQDSDKFLLQQRDNNAKIPYPNTWTFPGGNKNGNESPRETALRELREEVHLHPDHLEEVVTLHHHSRKVLGHFYYIPITRVNIDQLDEGAKWQLYSLDEIEKLNLGWWSREVLPILRRFSKELESRTHKPA